MAQERRVRVRAQRTVDTATGTSDTGTSEVHRPRSVPPAPRRSTIELSPDMQAEVDAYVEQQKIKFPDRLVTPEAVVHKLLRFGLDKAKGLAKPAVPLPAPEPVRSGPEEIITHAWAPGLVTPCGQWLRGNRHTTTPQWITCKECVAALRTRNRR